MTLSISIMRVNYGLKQTAVRKAATLIFYLHKIREIREIQKKLLITSRSFATHVEVYCHSFSSC